ncbi:BgTH12-05221 [Blumeria graminis f. sp. triticale]|uniref:BgTH12-05221 n=1 Tax=Blumeria graminis f. sp. triticale TaxID=1689686 RepID=A0A9W4D113_BLUGR|nr:BgTH12-05221 [Blumeria graminis f. sp. triticale]
MSRPNTISLRTPLPYRVEDASIRAEGETTDPSCQSASGRLAPPNSPSSDYTRSPRPSPPSKITLNLAHTVDFRAITYADAIDENLMCAICRCAFVDPLSTTCQHTFCSECLHDALCHSLSCPIDRLALNHELDLSPAPKIIKNQVDNLKVICPCCAAPISRSMLENHLSKYCPESSIRCPGINTNKKCSHQIPRKLAEQGCLHYSTNCPHCEEALWQIDLPHHQEYSCKARYTKCQYCGLETLRFREVEHANECPDAPGPCRWVEYGCPHQSLRRELSQHDESCSFRHMGKMGDKFIKEISDLRAHVRTLTEANQLQDRRIKFLESGSRQMDGFLDDADLTSSTSPAVMGAVSTEPLNSGHEYLLSLLEYQESKLSQLSAGMTELEAKQTTMLFNETIPIKNELAEIRSLQQTASMHIRWLMAFRIRENGKRVGGSSSSGSGSGSSMGEGASEAVESSRHSPFSRRRSDSLSRDIVTKL